ncbi:PREDICTED: uncharacterized protein LOC107341264 [Acropora digitifera]|uniref:uncharacterized protein LOC107341264 n=1 Tax=Acropora digitifera TaxID=70779 RepID=UPI00077A97D9|nr:PREDICTED: uncharacterized protein LOC107341264 [Acropora digitifera]
MAGSEVLFTSKGDGLQPYSKLKELARAVCYIEATSTDPQSNEEYQIKGSGFYCKLTLDGSVCYGVITNHHVLESREDCNRGYATFFYEGSENRLRVKLSPANTFRTHPVSLKQSLGCNLILYLKLQLNSTMKELWNI